MRVPPPGLLKLDRDLLLQDVKERLAERLPHYRDLPDDPTDPGWLLLEQAAWLAEILSEKLDQYPYSVVQQFVHMMGGHLRPAHPSLGVLLAEVVGDGTIKQDHRRASPYRFYTPQDEDMQSVEFVAAEQEVNLRAAEFVSAVEVASDELFLVGPEETGSGVDGLSMWRGERRRSGVFDREEIWFDAVTNNTEDLIAGIDNALKELADKRIGWLSIAYEQVSRERIRIVAKIDPAAAFARTVPDGIWVGGDLEGDWGTLDGTTWTPVVTIKRHPMLPPHIHGQFPLPGYEEGQILLTDIPENFSVHDLLDRKASPMPESVVQAIWTTLGNQDGRIATINPTIRVVIREAEVTDLEPDWIAPALESGLWPVLTQQQPKTVYHLKLLTPQKKKSKLRISLMHEVHAGAVIAKPQAFGITADGRIERTPLVLEESWKLPGPPIGRTTLMPTVVAYDAAIPANVAGILLVATQQPKAAMANTMLIANLPAVSDGRNSVVTRNVPTEYSLLYENAVDARVIEQLLREPVPDSAARELRQLALGYFTVNNQDPVKDYEGIKLDAAEGTITINAPDADGVLRAFRPGDRIRFEWYRRTDGALGNCGPNTVTLVEQPPTASPRINNATNPLGTFFGADREDPDVAVERMFGPAEGTPVMASDWERHVRRAIGARSRRWVVRCWTYAERALVSTAFWPFAEPGVEGDPEVLRVESALAQSGPETILVVVGPRDELISDEDLDFARRAVQRMVRRHAARLPTVKHAIVTRFWPLRMEVPEEHEDVTLPCYELDAMDGEVSDTSGRIAGEPPKALLLLNAAVTRVDLQEQELL